MESKLRRILAEAIEQIEAGAPVESVLARFPDHAAELRAHLSLWSALGAAPRVEADPLMKNRGRQGLLSRLTESEGEKRRVIPTFLGSAAARAGVVALGVLMLAGGSAAASGALGGPDVTGDALDAVGVAQNDGPSENANDNALERCENAEQGRNNVNPQSSNGALNANPRSFEGGNGEPDCDNDEGDCLAEAQESPQASPIADEFGLVEATPEASPDASSLDKQNEVDCEVEDEDEAIEDADDLDEEDEDCAPQVPALDPEASPDDEDECDDDDGNGRSENSGRGNAEDDDGEGDGDSNGPGVGQEEDPNENSSGADNSEDDEREDENGGSGEDGGSSGS